MPSHFRRRYAAAFPSEPAAIGREAYGRRKWRVLRAMPLRELVADFAGLVPGARAMTRAQLLHALRRVAALI